MELASRARNLLISALFTLTGSRVPGYLKEFRRLESASREIVNADQQQRLCALLLHAHEHVPYYKDVLGQCGVIRNGVVDLERFRDIPILDKDDLQTAGPLLHSDDVKTRHSFVNTSGGSTGAPARFIQDRAFYDQNVVAAKIIYNEYLGKLAGEPEINLWGSERDVLRGSLSVRERTINAVYNRRFLNAFSVSESDLRSFVDEINTHRPASMWVYVESLDVLATFIESESLRVHSPRFIISTAGTLFEPIRLRAERVFGCPVYNQYGSREVGAIAIETRSRNGMRGFPYLNYVETVDDEILVTCLTNYSMPLIRYRIGDTASGVKAKTNDKLGVEAPLMESVSGRIISHLKTPDGRLVHGQYLIHQFYFIDWIRKFQIVQNRLDEVVCNIVLNGSPIEKDIREIERNIRRVMGEKCRVEMNYCGEIPSSASGKYLYTICNC